MIQDTSKSKWAILDKDDNLYKVGVYSIENGLAFSNLYHKYTYTYSYGYSSTGKATQDVDTKQFRLWG